MGRVYRYNKNLNPQNEIIDEYPNYLYYTSSDKNNTKALLEKGINRISGINVQNTMRYPAILISSSPHKIGTETTPWEDIFDVDHGRIVYYGDNKNPDKQPNASQGNKALLDAYQLHISNNSEERKNAAPILFFRKVPVGAKQKGFIQFQGFGIIRGIRLITQFDPKKKLYFTNYEFEFVVFDLSAENEGFNWDWINKRKDPDVDIDNTIKASPKSWKAWIEYGSQCIEKYRRRAIKLLIIPKSEQIKLTPRERNTLYEIFDFYPGKRKCRFELLASVVAENVIQSSLGIGGQYRTGWITPGTSDYGIDFVGRLILGSECSSVKIVILGQAKCEDIKRPTSGIDIARTVARLKRGWIGVYVSTSFFSEKVQEEVLEDKFPIILINGKRVAQEVLKNVQNGGFNSVQEYLENLDRNYESRIERRMPEEILFD